MGGHETEVRRREKRRIRLRVTRIHKKLGSGTSFGKAETLACHFTAVRI